MIKQQEIATINRITQSLGGYVLGDIRKSINLTGENNMHIGSFILCSCFIDQVSAFYYGIKTLKIRRGKNDDPIYDFNVKQRFEKFCDDYLVKINNKYNSNHLEKLNSGTVLLLIETFYDDIKKAFEEWCDDLLTKEEIRKNAIEWFD